MFQAKDNVRNTSAIAADNKFSMKPLMQPYRKIIVTYTVVEKGMENKGELW